MDMFKLIRNEKALSSAGFKPSKIARILLGSAAQEDIEFIRELHDKNSKDGVMFFFDCLFSYEDWFREWVCCEVLTSDLWEFKLLEIEEDELVEIE